MDIKRKTFKKYYDIALGDTLAEAKSIINDLIERFGEESLIYQEGFDCPDYSIEYTVLETDMQFERRKLMAQKREDKKKKAELKELDRLRKKYE